MRPVPDGEGFASFLDEVNAERARQIREKGYDADYDDGHDDGAIAAGAAHFALPDDLERAEIWPVELGPVPDPAMPRRDELVRAAAMLAAEVDRLDRAAAGVPQAYLPHALCWQGRSIQCAVAIRVDALRFLASHPRLRAFSGLRPHAAGSDHRCGYALDMVPLNHDDRQTVEAAYRDAERLLLEHRVAYVEPLDLTWVPGNHHLHVSFRRCP